MRTPSLACALFAAAAVSFVNAAPLPAPGTYSSDVFSVSSPSPNSQPAPVEDNVTPPAHTHPRIGIKEIRDASPDHQPKIWNDRTIAPRALDADTVGGNAYSGATSDASGGSVTNSAKSFAITKRTGDDGTLGGNAYTGSSGDVDGGSVVNQGNNMGMPTIMNMNSNNGGAGGGSHSGCANGGQGADRGSGGNAYSGSTGSADGGEVFNSGGVMNVDSNNAGNAGDTGSGCASGGNVSDGA
ncbi:hypothetical protein C2E23DRAFT_744969 [Lenzites betulinus]|nr:hypothetical protein C2E23DRAFT_744969 [Lenzites betulinus]